MDKNQDSDDLAKKNELISFMEKLINKKKDKFKEEVNLYEELQKDAEREKLRWVKKIWKRLISRHTRGVVFIHLIYIVVSAAIIIFSGKLMANFGSKEFSLTLIEKLIFGGVGVFAIFSKGYELCNKRLCTVDLLSSEVISIVRIYSVGNIIGSLLDLYVKLESLNGLPISSIKGKALIVGEENYFTIFENNIAAVGELNPSLVGHIAAFYTFLKAARDSNRRLKLFADYSYPAENGKKDIINIVYLCFLQLINGNLAIQELTENGEIKDLVEAIFIGVELQCIGFLFAVMPKEGGLKYQLQHRVNELNRVAIVV